MSTAIIFSGQIRSYEACYCTQRALVYRHFPEAHFFFVVQADEAVEPALAQLRKDYPADRIHVRQLTDPTIEVTGLINDRWLEAPYANAAPPHQLLLQLWYQSQAWKFMAETENTLGETFDTLVRIRPDQWIRSFEMPKGVGEITQTRYAPVAKAFLHHSLHDQGIMEPNGSVTVVCPPPSGTAFTPWWGEFSGVNDRLAILGREAAFAYFTVYEQLADLLAAGHAFHPETLVRAALERAGTRISPTLLTEFDTWRPKGQPPKQGEYLNAFGYAVRPAEILPWDLAHAALRAA